MAEHNCETPAAYQGHEGQTWNCPECEQVWVGRQHDNGWCVWIKEGGRKSRAKMYKEQPYNEQFRKPESSV